MGILRIITCLLGASFCMTQPRLSRGKLLKPSVVSIIIGLTIRVVSCPGLTLIGLLLTPFQSG